MEEDEGLEFETEGLMLKYFCSPPQLKSICTWETHDKGPSLLPHGSEWEDMWQENELCARNA